MRLSLNATGLALLLLFCIIPGLILSYFTLQEPWTMFRIARANVSLQEQQIAQYITAGAGYRAEHIGGELLQSALIKATGWSLEAIGLLPIGSLLLAFLYFAFAKLVCRSNWAAAAIAIYGSWYYPGLYSQYGTQTYVWAHSLFLCFLSLLFVWLRHKTPLVSVLIITVFVATFLHYHTTPLWIIVAVAFAVSALNLANRADKLKQAIPWSLPLVFVVIYFTFDTVIYGNGLARLRAEASSESLLQSFANKIIAPLFSVRPHTLRPFEVAPINPRLATWSTLLVLILLVAPVAFWCCAQLVNAVKARNLLIFVATKERIFICSVISAAVAHAAIYSTYGSVSIRVIPLVFPLILPLIYQELRISKRGEAILLSVMASSAILGFGSFISTLAPDATASATGLASKLIEPNKRIIGDANMYGALLLSSAEDNKIVDFTWINSANYAAVVGGSPSGADEFDYVAIERSDKPLTSNSWAFYEPWVWHLPEIDRNAQLNRVYDSDNMILLQRTGVALPQYQVTGADLSPHRQDDFTNMLRLFAAALALFVIPGLAVVLLFNVVPSFRVENRYIAGSIAVSISIALTTFVGYIANFTPLGLDWLMPIAVAVPCLVMIGYVAKTRLRVRLPKPLVIYSAALLLAVLAWAAAATMVAGARAQRYSDYTEFFVTKPAPQATSLTLNVVSRLHEPAHFTIAIRQAGQAVEQIAVPDIAPNSAWSVSWPIARLRSGGPLIVALSRDGTPIRELRLSDLDALSAHS